MPRSDLEEDYGDHYRPLRWYHVVVMSPVFVLFGTAELIRRTQCKLLGHREKDDYCNRCHMHLNAKIVRNRR